jgi:aspartate carbamoyltransferase
MKHTPFTGRSLTAIRDFNRHERLYLYDTTRRLKEAMTTADRDPRWLDAFRIDDPDLGMYEIFLENSTRTRESFKNAALFHRIKLSELNAESSSFNKKESYTDTINNLAGYGNRIFVLRTSLEGVCRHLAEQTERYRLRHGLTDRISCINAGDGRHEHPTQELLDEFTFLEDLDWSSASIHLALVGDLYHGRTVHSKVYGLDLFNTVRVDLIAPSELAMPRSYVRAMENQGFRVRSFDSIESYLAQTDVAPQWYFTRPQLERMGERVLRRQDELRRAITFTPEMIGGVAESTRFYHPLPRHRDHPTIPTALDDTFLNAWERQSANGYLVRIILLSLIAGATGDDYEGPVGPDCIDETPCFGEVRPTSGRRKQYSEGVRPIRDGLVIDHICAGDDPDEIRRHLGTLQRVGKLHGRGGEWISTGRDGAYKGILFRPDFGPVSDRDIATLAAVVPGATVNVISRGEVVRKVRLKNPTRIAGVAGLECTNPACITRKEHGEQIDPTFTLADRDRYACDYCSHEHGFKEIWR